MNDWMLMLILNSFKHETHIPMGNDGYSIPEICGICSAKPIFNYIDALLFIQRDLFQS